MSFQISKNKMSFVADSNEKNLLYSNSEAVYIPHDGIQVIGEVDVSAADLNHFTAMAHFTMPGVAENDEPECRITADWDGGGETTDLHMNHHMEPNSGQSRGGAFFSFKDTINQVALMVLPNQAARDASQSFTIPANSEILFSLSPQDAVLNQLSFTGPSVPATPSGFTLSGGSVSGYYTGAWSYAGKVRRAGPNFTSSTDIGIYRHDYGDYVYVLYYYSEGIPESPVWALTQFGNNTGANSITSDHNFLDAAGMTGTQIQLVSGSSQTANGVLYPPADALGGTLTIG